MCYMLLLSTDSPEDLSLCNGELVAFSREIPPLAEAQLLAYLQRWFVGSRDGCSCGFRHLPASSVELGFSAPVDWFPEEAQDVEATLRLIGTIRRLVENGARVDCIDVWGHETSSAAASTTLDVNLDEIADAAFRLFENHRFVFYGGGRGHG